MSNKRFEAKKIVKNFLDKYFEEQDDAIDKEGPKLETFVPASNALLASIWDPDRTNTVPCGRNADVGSGFIKKQFPALLFSGLDPRGGGVGGVEVDVDERTEQRRISQPNAYKHIDKWQHDGPVFLFGTSGAGKTRTVFEHLSRNKGFYLLAGDMANNPGSADLHSVLDKVPLTDAEAGTNTGLEESVGNRDRMKQWLSLLIFVRYAVHQKLEKDVLNRQMTAYEWLLYQLFPIKFFGCDLFKDIVKAVTARVVVDAIMSFDMWDPDDYDNTKQWSIFVDEAQRLLNMKQTKILSFDGERRRSALSACMDGFSGLRNENPLCYPVFSGTGLSYEQFEDEARSVTAKALQITTINPKDLIFSDFNVLSADGVQEYMKKFLRLSSVRDDVLVHVSKWLRGRPRWVASFIEVYVSRRALDNKFEQAGISAPVDLNLMEALHRYLKIMTTEHVESDVNRCHSWSAGKRSAYALFQQMGPKVMNFPKGSHTFGRLYYQLQQAVCKFAVGQKPHVFNTEEIKALVEKGIATVHGSDMTGSFDEPIIVKAGINYFGLEYYLENLLSNQESGGQGEAFGKLLIPGLIKKEEEFHKIHRFSFEQRR